MAAFKWLSDHFQLPGYYKSPTENKHRAFPFSVWNKNANSPYRSNIYGRNFAAERKQIIEGEDKIGLRGMTTAAIGGAALWGRRRNIEFGKYFVTDNIYNAIRHAEHVVPVFRIPLQASQMGDLVSPFVSDKTLNWVYKGAEIFDSEWNWRSNFKELGEQIFKDNKRFSISGGRTIDSVQAKEFIRQHGLRFQKRGRVFGDLVIPGTRHGDIALRSNIFMMERPSSLAGGIANLWESSQRQTTMFEAWGKDNRLINLIDRWSGGLSDKAKMRMRKAGGFLQGYVGSYFGEYVRAMNRFMHDPIPWLGEMLGEVDTTTRRLGGTADDMFYGMLDRFASPSHIQTGQKIPFSKLTFDWMRPYVSDPKLTKSPLKMLAALSAKGAFYTIGVPAAYMGFSHLRRQFDQAGDSMFSVPMFAGIGLGVGSLLRTQKQNWSMFGKVPVTRSMLAGAAAGAVVGASSAFDKGLTAGLGAMYARFRMGSSRLWNMIGAQDAMERQEALMPGITSPITAAGFGMFGGMLGWLSKEIGTTRQILGFGPKDIAKFAPEFQAARDIMAATNEAIFGKTENLKQIVDQQRKQFLTDMYEGKISKVMPLLEAQLPGATPMYDKYNKVMLSEDWFDKLWGQELAVPETAEKQALDKLMDYQRKIADKTGARDQFRKVMDFYAKRDTPGHGAAMKEITSILEGKPLRAVPHTEGGFLATVLYDQIQNIDDPMMEGLRERLQSESNRSEYAKRIYREADSMVQALGEDALSKNQAGRGIFGRMRESFKATFKRPKPGFMRGAARGLALFGGLSMVGTVAAGAMGGNFSPGDFVPGWLVRLTGGGMKPQETDEVFTGEKEVAIRKGRWWLFGRSPFEGSKIQYFRKHRAVLMQSDAEDNALYGSYDEKMAYEPIFHPIRALFDTDFKYHREMRMSLISPTPLTGRMFTDVPILGDLLGNTVGQLIKPTLAIRPNEWMHPGSSASSRMLTGGSPVQTPASYGRWHAMRNAPTVTELGGDPSVSARSPYGLFHGTKWTFERMSEQAGLRGFMFSTFLEGAFGYQTRTYEPVVESAESTFSLSSKFWSMNLGDPGYTEAIRRYLSRDRNAYYNPLRNLAPSWLPENNYFRDFHHGNYYRKVNEGAIRLPGPGLETLYPELRGIHPENYPLAYKYKVLTDVAYQSDEWEFTKERLIHAVQAGNLTPREKKIVADVNEQIRERSKKRNFRGYQFESDDMYKKKLHISAVFDDGTFSVNEFGKRQVQIGGLNFSMAALTRQMMERHNLKTVAEGERMAREKRLEIISHIKKKLAVGQAVEAYIPKEETELYANKISEVYIPGLSEELRGMGAEFDKDDRVGRRIGYNKAQRAIGRAWELFTHNIDLPITPAAALNQILPFHPQSKFIQRLTPAELYARTQVYGRDIQMWQRYREDFLETAIHENVAKLTGDYVPRKVAYRRTLAEYFDKLTWLKNFVMEQAAREGRNDQAAEYYQEKRRQTLFGADPYRGFSNIWRALPRSERDFYRDFVKETDEKERDKIMALVPESSKHIYAAQWQRRDMQALRNKIDSGRGDEQDKRTLYAMYNMQRVEGMNWNRELQSEYDNETRGNKNISYADWMRLKQLSRYFQSFQMPEKNWVGFDPRVDLEDVKLRVAQQEGIDIHDMGLWESREVSLSSKPYVTDAARGIDDWSGEGMTPGEFEARIRQMMKGAQSLIQVTPLPPGTQSRVVMLGKDSREWQIRQLLGGRGAI